MANIMQVTSTDEIARVRISIETVAIILIVVLSALLRFVGLGEIPLTDAEAHEAIAAYHRATSQHPALPEGEILLPMNTLGALFNTVALMLLDHSDGAARLSTAIVGVLLALAPLLYGRWIGRVSAILMSIGLAVSPVAISASRTMGGMVWAGLLLMVMGWFILRFVETRQKSDAIAATLLGVGVLLLTTPTGILLLLGMLFGLTAALVFSPKDDPLPRHVSGVVSAWPGLEGLAAAFIMVVVVATGFFTDFAGMSSVAQIPEAFYKGLSQQLPNAGANFALWVSLRYDAAFIVFALIGLYLARRDMRFAERFLGGMLFWGLLSTALYAGSSADMALMVTLPAVGLTTSAFLRLLEDASEGGLWEIPNWLLPVQILVVMGLAAAVVISLSSAFNKLVAESKPVPYADNLEFVTHSGNNVQIGTIAAEQGASSMVVNLPYFQLFNCLAEAGERDPDTLRQDTTGRYCDVKPITTVTLQVEPIDRHLQSGEVRLLDATGSPVYGPEPLGDGVTFVYEATTNLDASSPYYLEVRRMEGQSTDQAGQYATLAYAGDLTQDKGFDALKSGAIRLEFPRLMTFLTVSARNPNPAWMLAVLFGGMLIPITFFSVGAVFGARASARGIACGLLIYLMLYGVGLSLDTTLINGGDPRELWNRQGVTEGYQTLQRELIQYSRRDTGTDYDIAITVQAPTDGALAWALQKFHKAQFVSQPNSTVETAAMLVPDGSRPTVAAEYVGTQMVFEETWSLKSLAWTDAGGWVFDGQKTRFQPTPIDVYRLWIRKDVYGVETVPE